MTKLRRNHHRTDRSGFSSMLMKVGLFFIVAILGFVYIYKNVNGPKTNYQGSNNSSGYDLNTYEDTESLTSAEIIPDGSTGEIVNHDYYSLSYIEEYEVPEWVAYKLTANSLRQPNVKRAKRFTQDYAVKTKSAKHKDYSHSGYTRGHLAPAGDMAFSTEAMKQTFFMSNMTPQTRAFNGGVWRELEETVRDWAMANDELYIVSGPIFNQKPKNFIGKNKVAVPDAFFKVILDNYGNTQKAIGFIIPHKKSSETLDNYAVTIDEVEQLTGFDFFDKILLEREEQIESSISVKEWPLDKRRYKQRTNNWNNN